MIIYQVLTLLTCIISCLALVFSIVALIKVLAMEKSTHTIQYMPVDETVKNWATPEKEVESINKEFSSNFDMEEDLDVRII